MERAKRTGQALRDWWVDHLWADLLAVTIVVVVHAVVVLKTGRFDVLGWLEAGDRRGVYSATAVVVSLTGAFSGVAVAQLGSAKGARAVALKRQAGTQLARSWRSIYGGAMLSALLAITALILDSTASEPIGKNSTVAMWAFEFGLFLGIVKFCRLSALFYPLIVTSVRDDIELEKEPVLTPKLDIARFERRVAGK